MNSKYLWFQKIIMTPLYRIRDKNEKQYRNDLILDILNNVCSMTINYSTNGRLYIVKNVNSQDDYIIERCTWIQDINWNRIFEWDIYKVDWITFSKDWIEIEPTVNNIIDFIADFTDRDFWYSEERIEVVWNIHS